MQRESVESSLISLNPDVLLLHRSDFTGQSKTIPTALDWVLLIMNSLYGGASRYVKTVFELLRCENFDISSIKDNLKTMTPYNKLV